MSAALLERSSHPLLIARCTRAATGGSGHGRRAAKPVGRGHRGEGAESRLLWLMRQWPFLLRLAGWTSSRPPPQTQQPPSPRARPAPPCSSSTAWTSSLMWSCFACVSVFFFMGVLAVWSPCRSPVPDMLDRARESGQAHGRAGSQGTLTNRIGCGAPGVDSHIVLRKKWIFTP